MFFLVLNLCLFLSGIIICCLVIVFIFYFFFSDFKSESGKIY